MSWSRSTLSRSVSGLAIGAVAGVAGAVSYSHIYALTLRLHQSVLTAHLMPIGIDGLIVAGSVVLLQSSAWLGWVAVGPGVAISLFANVESGIRYGILPAIWAGVPAVSFFLATFVLERWLSAQSTPVAIVQGPVTDLVPQPETQLSPVAASNGSGSWSATSAGGWS